MIANKSLARKPRHRSPNYPGHPLGTSLDDIAKLYQAEKRATFPLETAARAIGYNSLNGAARVRLAAMRQYGLLEQKKGEEARLTDRALTLVLRNPASREYKEALRDAALEPILIRSMFETKVDASDDNLRHHLIVNEGFTDDGARRFIESFRATISIANLTSDNTISRPYDDVTIETGESEISAPVQEELEVRQSGFKPTERRARVPLPLMGGTITVSVELPYPMTEEAWEQMMGMLRALKPGYVAPSGGKQEPKPQPFRCLQNPPAD